MPRRKESLINKNIYHVYNKTIDAIRIFKDKAECELFLELMYYYRSSKSLLRFSRFKSADSNIRKMLLNEIKLTRFYRVEVFSYTLMPNHFHFLMMQKLSNGIQELMANVLNSFTRIYNLKNKRSGPVLLPRFKSIRIKSDEQLIHTSRYIHLNPYSSNVVGSLDELAKYPWSSFRAYISSDKNKLVNPKYILKLFNNNKSRYKKFVFNHAEYQKRLESKKKEK